MSNVELVKKMDMAGLNSLWRGMFSGKFMGPYDPVIMSSRVYADIMTAASEEIIKRTKDNPLNIITALHMERMLNEMSDNDILSRVEMHLASTDIPIHSSKEELISFIMIVCSPFRPGESHVNNLLSVVSQKNGN